MNHTPSIQEWGINGESTTAWISDTEVFEVRPTPEGEYVLQLDNVADLTSTYLGTFGYRADAHKAARVWLGDN